MGEELGGGGGWEETNYILKQKKFVCKVHSFCLQSRHIWKSDYFSTQQRPLGCANLANCFLSPIWLVQICQKKRNKNKPVNFVGTSPSQNFALQWVNWTWRIAVKLRHTTEKWKGALKKKSWRFAGESAFHSKQLQTISKLNLHAKQLEKDEAVLLSGQDIKAYKRSICHF